MIVETEGGLGFLSSFSEDFADVLGDARIAAIDRVIHTAVFHNLNQSYLVAVSGALRWDVRLRPEVLINCEGRML